MLQHLNLSRCKQVTDLGLMGLESRSHRASLASLDLAALPRCTTSGLAFVGLGVGRSKKEQQTFLRARFGRRVARAKRALLAGGFVLAANATRLAAGDDDADASESEVAAKQPQRPRPKLPSAAAFKYGKPKVAEALADEWAATAPPQAPKIPPLNVYAVRGVPFLTS